MKTDDFTVTQNKVGLKSNLHNKSQKREHSQIYFIQINFDTRKQNSGSG